MHVHGAVWFAAVAAVAVVASCGEDKVADGVRLGTLDVGGLSREDVRLRVQRDLAGTPGFGHELSVDPLSIVDLDEVSTPA